MKRTGMNPDMKTYRCMDMKTYRCRCCKWEFEADLENLGKDLDPKDWYSIPSSKFRDPLDRCPLCGLMTKVNVDGVDDNSWYEEVPDDKEERG